MNHPSGISTLVRVGSSAVNTLNSEPAKILVIDDNSFSRMTAVDLLSLDGYEVLEADSSSSVINCVLESKPDLILLDVMMPDIDGFEVCKLLKQDKRTHLIPVIFTTVLDDRRSRIRAREVGGDDFLSKPLYSLELSAKVKSWIYQKRLNEDLDRIEQVLFSIARAIENRYPNSGNSCARLANLAQSFGEYLQLSTIDIQNLRYAAYLHDIGTVGIPDDIMLKKGELTPEEREMINQHVLIGEQICQPLPNGRGVLPIIRHHHERWNGSGYPDGLVGNNIPWLAQVFQILDIYDALTSERPYKPAFPPAQALEIIAEETAKGWRNPQLVQQFTAFILNPPFIPPPY
ncbi:MAG: HD domain-containing phosphohydrolase [Xenococcaceae cyanobacterium]